MSSQIKQKKSVPVQQPAIMGSATRGSATPKPQAVIDDQGQLSLDGQIAQSLVTSIEFNEPISIPIRPSSAMIGTNNNRENSKGHENTTKPAGHVRTSTPVIQEDKKRQTPQRTPSAASNSKNAKRRQSSAKKHEQQSEQQKKNSMPS